MGRLSNHPSFHHIENESASRSVVSHSLQPMDCSLPGSSVHGIYQARILEWVAISSSRGSSRPKDRTQVSCIFHIGRQILYRWATREAQCRVVRSHNHTEAIGKSVRLSIHPPMYPRVPTDNYLLDIYWMSCAVPNNGEKIGNVARPFRCASHSEGGNRQLQANNVI